DQIYLVSLFSPIQSITFTYLPILLVLCYWYDYNTKPHYGPNISLFNMLRINCMTRPPHKGIFNKSHLLSLPHSTESVPAENITDRLYMKWYKVFGDNYNDKKRAIVIPETGYYFVYATFALSCQDEVEDESFKKFYVTLHRWNEGYRQEKTIGSAMDGIECSSDRSRSVFMGQLFYLLNGDHVSVWIEEGYKLITKSSFGAYST
uniref:THD domain-containing protein n=1 Tax=Mastacembelus armatus TaxID=205130 RepID=A0A3Q3NCP8_9TELE